VLDRLFTRAGSWWPLVPAGVLVLVGAGVPGEIMRWLFREGWPLAFVAVGVFLILRSLFGSGREATESVAAPADASAPAQVGSPGEVLDPEE